jgi:HEAT repeat protein
MEAVIINRSTNCLKAYSLRRDPDDKDAGKKADKSTVKLAAEYYADDDKDHETLWEYLENCGHTVKTLFIRKNVPEKKIEELLSALGNEDADVRDKAACDLNELIGTDISAELRIKTVNSLINALEDKDDWHLRDGAAFSLEYLTQREISADTKENSALKEMMVSPLVKAMADENKSVRDHVENALENLVDSDISIESKRTITRAFIKALKNDNEDIRDMAADALAYLAQSGIHPELKSKMVEPLIEALQDDSWRVRNGAAYALENLAISDIPDKMRSKMVEPLIKAFRTEVNCDSVRTHEVFAMENLVQSNIPREFKIEMAEPLIEALADKDPDIRESAKRSLNSLINSPDIPATIKSKFIGLDLTLPRVIERE